MRLPVGYNESSQTLRQISDIQIYIKVHFLVHFLHLDIFSKVTLRSDEDERSQWGVLSDLGDPLLRDVLEGGRIDNAEAQQEHVHAGVTQRAQLVKLVLERWRSRHREKKSINRSKRMHFFTAQHDNAEYLWRCFSWQMINNEDMCSFSTLTFVLPLYPSHSFSEHKIQRHSCSSTQYVCTAHTSSYLSVCTVTLIPTSCLTRAVHLISWSSA